MGHGWLFLGTFGFVYIRTEERKGWFNMPFEVTLHTGESQESLLRRFQKMVQMSGVLREFRSHQRFMSKRDAYLVKAKNTAKRKRQQHR